MSARRRLPTARPITKPVEGEGKFIQQSGGRGQYGHVCLKMEPNEQGKGVEIVDKIKGGTIPSEYIPAVREGAERDAAERRARRLPGRRREGHDLRRQLHEVDSNEIAFKMAASIAFKDGMRQASPILLEPIMAVEVETPEDFMGNVMGDLASRRGIVHGMEDNPTGKVIKAEVPLADMFGYSTTLRS